MTNAALIRKSKRQIFFLFTVALLVLGLPFVATQNVFCQNAGWKYFKNYNPKEYNRHDQNWSVLQDKRGIIYVGNNRGVLEFDGLSWRSIDVPNDPARSLAIDDAGIIYVGGEDEIGFLAPDSNGSLQYNSLLDHLENNKRNFGTVWRTHSTKEGIYFRTGKYLFRWSPNNKQLKVWSPPNKFNASYTREGKYFIQDVNDGLMYILNDSLEPFPGSEEFKGVKIYMMVPYGADHKMLIGTRSKGFYIHDGIKAEPFLIEAEADDYIKKNILLQGIGLVSSPGDFALATLKGGIVVIDSRGKLKQIFDKTCGLLDDSVMYVFEDSPGNLWLALSKGIAKIEYASPFSFYDDRSNLPGLVQSVVKHGKHLYAGTSSGLYFLSSSHRFRPSAGISINCWSLLSIEDSLLAAATDGVFQVRINIKRRVIKNPSYFLLRSQKESNRIWVGTREGLVSLYLYKKDKNRQWEEEHKCEIITQDIKTIVEDKKGNLWLGTKTKGVLKVDFPGDKTIMHPKVAIYNTSHGLPKGWIRVFLAAEHVMFATKKGIFRFDELKKIFVPDYTLGGEFAGGEKGRSVFRIVEDKNKNIWLHSKAKNIQAILKPDGTFVLSKKPFLRTPRAQVNTIYPDPGGDIIWFAGNDGLIRYDTRVKKNYDSDFQTLIRKVVVNGKLIFDGYKQEELFPIIPYKNRNLRFEFAAPFFEAENWTQYQCFLEGYEKDWSAWSSETWKSYTNLDPWLYTFRVRAKNVYENLSREAAFQFKILPPWYRTWWAYAVYVFAGFLVLFLVVRWRSGKLQREKQKLEQIVKERTKEIKKKNRQLQEQSEKLKEIDHVKSRFFANISHEFRTPLTLIMGPLEQVLSDYHGKDSQLEKKVKLMLRNSQRLFTLINRLLDLSKLDSGKMHLQTARQNMIPFLKGIVASFDLLAGQYDLDLSFQADEEEINLYFDLEKMEDVLCNLLINAVKFTPGGGKITVSAKRITKKQEHFPAGYLEISIGDTGPGIPPEQLAHIFDRFYQSDSTYEHHQKGTGLGLALTRELINLHHGKVDVHSRENSGTEFLIRLPLGKEHLKPQEIVAIDETPPERRKPFEIPAAYMVEKEQGVPVDVEASQAGNGQPGNEIDSLKSEKDIILVVEDSADVREYIRGALEPLYAVKDAKNGKEGIRKAQEIIPDLIISDIMMPGVDGYELCAALKKDIKTSHIPIVLLTAKASEENIIRGLETGADDYITKPFSTKLLMARIKNLVDLRRHFQLTLYRQMTKQPVKMSLSQMDREFIKELQDMIEKNLSDPDFNVERLGKKLYMSRATLYRKINALSGESPIEFLQSYRLKRGAELLENNFGTVLEVAFEVGFSSASYFSKCFKKKFNRLPSAFQPSGSQ